MKPFHCTEHFQYHTLLPGTEHPFLVGVILIIILYVSYYQLVVLFQLFIPSYFDPNPVFFFLQLVLLFELFIPLVLFVILLAIRNKQPANPVSAGKY